MTTIKTSSWFEKLPPDHLRIGISRGTPRGIPAGYRLFRKLAPGDWFNSVPVPIYRQRYFEGLSMLDPGEVVDELKTMAGDKTPVLCCFEAPRKLSEWCHRAFVSVWLEKELGLQVFELGMEDWGCGWQHPKLPPALRRKPEPASLFPTLDVVEWMGKKGIDDQGRVWTVIGRDPQNHDQAAVACLDERRSVSLETLKQRFK